MVLWPIRARVLFELFYNIIYMTDNDKLYHPLTPTSDQNRISPYNINTISSRQGMRIKILTRGFLVDPIPRSPN